MLIACNDSVGILCIKFVGAIYIEAGMDSRYVEDSIFGRIELTKSDEAEIAVLWVKDRHAGFRAQLFWE